MGAKRIVQVNSMKKSKLVISYEITMILLALISVSFIWVENESFQIIDQLVWLIFVVDYAVRLIRADHKLTFVKQNPFDLIAIIPLDSIFRLGRLARLFRILRAITLIVRYGKPFFELLKTNGLHRVVSFTCILIFVSSIPIVYVEPSIETFEDAVWWSVVTATTVGYGDYSPETGIGRAIAVVLMILGIGLIGMVTSSLSSYFVGNSTKREEAAALSDDEIDRLIDALQKMKSSR